jgi:hypothetical protein
MNPSVLLFHRVQQPLDMLFLHVLYHHQLLSKRNLLNLSLKGKPLELSRQESQSTRRRR